MQIAYLSIRVSQDDDNNNNCGVNECIKHICFFFFFVAVVVLVWICALLSNIEWRAAKYKQKKPNAHCLSPTPIYHLFCNGDLGCNLWQDFLSVVSFFYNIIKKQMTLLTLKMMVWRTFVKDCWTAIVKLKIKNSSVMPEK